MDDREGQYVHTITLGYTFYEIDLSEDELQAALNLPSTLTRSTLTSATEIAIDSN